MGDANHCKHSLFMVYALTQHTQKEALTQPQRAVQRLAQQQILTRIQEHGLVWGRAVCPAQGALQVINMALSGGYLLQRG